MELLYAKEHLTCCNYDAGERPAVQVVDVISAEPSIFSIIEPEILLVLDGSINISFEKIENGVMSAGEMVILPPCSRAVLTTETTAQLLIFRLHTNIQLCDTYSFAKLNEESGGDAKEFEGRLNTLQTNEMVDDFVCTLLKYINDGLKCIYFFEIKIKELLFMFRAYYPKKKLAAFFNSLLSADSHFLCFVMNNYSKVSSVKEFAVLAGYSLSGFDKQFRKVFGMSAYQWMKQKRLKSIYHEINCSSKTLREICDDQGFLSLSQFNDYCKKNLGMPPGKIRRKVGCVKDMK